MVITFKINFEKLSPDHDHPDMWFQYCIDSFGRGYSFRDAEVMKKHLESKKEFRNVQVVPMEEVN